MQFKEWFKLKSDTDRPTKRSYMILIGLIGLLFLILSNVFSGSSDDTQAPIEESQWEDEKKEKQSGNTTNSNYEHIQNQMRQELEQALESISDVHDVEVSLQLDSSAIKVFEKNTTTTNQYTDENDQNGGTRSVEDESVEEQTVLLRQNNREEPLLIQTQTPAIRGVLIVAKGVDQIHVKERIIDSVSRLLDVSTHRIAVMPKGEEE
ncbi:stage III sporulation protein AG [Alkalibacillus almallahensis]|uniref:stage III sporulation protein AG n=1 Tax=Alkalibacillus almallahensis TaxID=1379154 RepID=UPI00141FB96D|nr:stage III sporulation protein AG [Alkalibacillus almallahensis]NIK12415.1 stage III sporulation protein AG [Alkalibacillus almallahensis]